jgi:hypothetical protein
LTEYLTRIRCIFAAKEKKKNCSVGNWGTHLKALTVIFCSKCQFMYYLNFESLLLSFGYI